jgi:transcriptional regulator with XRE-family HTH domain
MPTTPQDIPTRDIFSHNLRLLIQSYPSVSEICRRIGLNRAQFNRYLGGESYPRPDTLQKMCSFFGVDARILTEPLETLTAELGAPKAHPEIAEFMAQDNSPLSNETFPSGFFRFSRQSFLYPERFMVGLLFVYRKDGQTFIKGSEARQSVTEQGLPTDRMIRQYRGEVIQVEDGIGHMISRRNGLTVTFNFLAPVASLNRNFWHGYAARTVSETLDATRVTRMVYEFLGNSTAEILKTARATGFCSEHDLVPYHKRLLRIGEPFS